MPIEQVTIETNCVIWRNIWLPHRDEYNRSPDFYLDKWQCSIQVYHSWEVYPDDWGVPNKEEWIFTMKYSDSSKSFNYVITPYVEKMGQYVRLDPTIKSATDFSIRKSSLSDIFGSEEEYVTVLFAFSEHSLTIESKFKEVSGISQEKDSGKEVIQSPCLKGLSEDIGQLLNKDEYADATLMCGDKSFSVHRVILTARSEVFSAMFQHDMSEKKSGVVDIIDLEPNILELFLGYLYSGEVEQMSVCIALDLYQAAEKYSVSTLKQLCVSYILENMSEDIVCEVLLVADKAGDVEFLDKIASFAAKIEGFLTSIEWKDFAKKFPNIAVNVFFKYHN